MTVGFLEMWLMLGALGSVAVAYLLELWPELWSQPRPVDFVAMIVLGPICWVVVAAFILMKAFRR